ncbi:hypothetical protein [Psychrobacter sp. I-STPA6b]|uniref:hypothetical protein n=1 Tax=Psychrobacter sp. I-STPA6b TaxID=2585718 RepID=UPI001D0C6179|nr:hypothetical protein [Psychrobacter sp. I-STPA6b]
MLQLIELAKDICTAGRTYRGKNTTTQIVNDTKNIYKAKIYSLDSHRANPTNDGYNKKGVNKFIDDNIKK